MEECHSLVVGIVDVQLAVSESTDESLLAGTQERDRIVHGGHRGLG